MLLALIPLLADRLWLFYLIFALIGILGAGANALPYLRTVSAWFDRRRGLAIGVVMGGSSMGFVYVPPMVQYLIDNQGWRYGYFALAIISLVVAVPLVYFVLRDKPSAADIAGSTELQASPDNAESASHLPVGQLLRNPLLWQLFVIFCLLSFCLYGTMSHLVAMLRDRGMEPGSAALVQSTLGIAVVASRVLIGLAIDRFFAPWVASACFILSALGVGLLAMGAVDSMAMLAAICVGLSMGAEIDMLAYLTGRYFGVENFGQVYGILFISFLLGTSIGPVTYGLAYESTGSYIVVLMVSIGLLVFSTIATLMLPRYKSSQATGTA